MARFAAPARARRRCVHSQDGPAPADTRALHVCTRRRCAAARGRRLPARARRPAPAVPGALCVSHRVAARVARLLDGTPR
eukprot:627932-Prymnesium_polylepis.1